MRKYIKIDWIGLKKHCEIYRVARKAELKLLSLQPVIKKNAEIRKLLVNCRFFWQ